MIRPLGNRVLVRPMEPETTSSGGIIIPSSAQERSTTGRVLAVGPGLITDQGVRVPTDSVVGDVVYFIPRAATEVVIDGEKLLMLEEEAILGILDQ